jgi:hypothetical protein
MGPGRESGRGGLAALAGAGSGGQGDTELGKLRQVETGFVRGAEFVPSDLFSCSLPALLGGDVAADRFQEKLGEGNAFLESDLLDAREDVAREVNSCELATIRESQYACDDAGSPVGAHGRLAGVGFRLRSGGGFATPS